MYLAQEYNPSYSLYVIDPSESDSLFLPSKKPNVLKRLLKKVFGLTQFSIMTSKISLLSLYPQSYILRTKKSFQRISSEKYRIW